MVSERGIGDAVDQARVLTDEVFEQGVVAAVLTLALTARCCHGLVQDCFSRKHSLDFNHEDRWDGWFVWKFLWENVGASAACDV
jgi:hypothetical protein